MPVIFFDIETRSPVSLKTAGVFRYAADDATEALCVGFAIDDAAPEIWLPGQPIPPAFTAAAGDPAWTVVAHNHEFERAIVTRLLAPRFNWPLIPIAQQACTMVMARAAGLPGALEKVAAALGLPHQKDAAGAALMKQMASPRRPRKGEDPAGIYWIDSPEQRQRLAEYCMQDVEVERELFQRLPPLPSGEQRLFALDALVNERGFHVDVDLANAARAIAQLEAAAIDAQIAELTGGEIAGVHQTARILDYARSNGHNLTALGKRNVSAALAHKPDDDVGRLLTLRQEGAKSSTAKFDSLLAGVDADGRMRGCLKFFGSSTGRWSGARFQPQNLPRPAGDVDAAVAAVLSGDMDQVRKLGAPLAVASDVLRSIVTAAPGHKLIGGDFSAVESRVLSWLAGEQWKLDAYRQFDSTGDPALEPYCAIASKILKRQVTPDDEAGRATGKVADLAFGFGGGRGAFRKFDSSDTHSDAEVERFKTEYRRAHAATTRLWYALGDATIAAVGRGRSTTVGRLAVSFEDGMLYITLPSGRRLSYPRARLGPGKFENSTAVYFHDNARGAWSEVDSWFGIFVENVTQAVARDLLAAAMLRLEANNFRVCLHIHDEIISEVPDTFGSQAEFLRIMLERPDWAQDLPLAAKTWSGERYGKSKPIEAATPADAEPIQPDPTTAASAESNAAPWDDIEHVRDLYAEQGATETTAKPEKEEPPARESKSDDVDRDNNATRDYVSGNQKAGGTFETAYVYPDPGGNPHSRTLVFRLPDGDKRCAQQFRVNGCWVNEKPAGWVPLPFNLPTVIKADRSVPIWICEGEPDAIAVGKEGYVTTTNSEGAGHFTADHAKWFTGWPTVYVVTDKDVPGEAHGRRVAELLHGVGVQDIRIVSFPELEGLPPWPNGKKKKDVSDWLKLGHAKEELLERARTAPRWQPPAATWIDISNWDRVPVPERKWAIPDRVPANQVGIFSGPGGGGKSILELMKDVAHVAAKTWLLDMLPTAGPAFYLGAEDPEDEIHRRLATITEHYGVTFGELAKGGLHVMCLFGKDATLCAPAGKSGKIETTALYRHVYEMAGDIKPRNISLDTLTRVFAGSEIDRVQVYGFAAHMQALAMATDGGSVTVLSHPSLHGISSGSGLSGSTGWHDAFRFRQYLHGLKTENGERPDGDLRELEFMKNQYGRLADAIVLRWQAGLFLPEPGINIDQVAREAKAEEIFLNLLRRYTAEDRFASDQHSPAHAPSLFAKEEETKKAGVSKHDLDAAMRRLFAAKKIRNEECRRSGRKTYRLAINS
jgi:RecA-family ATPase